MHDGIYTLMGRRPLCAANTVAATRSPLRRLSFVGPAIVLGVTLFFMTLSGLLHLKKAVK